MNSFEGRKAPHDSWAEEVFRSIREEGWILVPMGIERIAPNAHPRLKAMLDPDPTSAFLRFMPDGFAVHPTKAESYFFDIKTGYTIEREPYECYRAFAGNDRQVFLYLYYAKAGKYLVPLPALVFLDSWRYIATFPEEWQMPVDEEGWICPRDWPEDKYQRWKSSHPTASGTPFRYLDFPAMERFRRRPRKIL